ncbi:MAG: 30S ribosomal protein S2 [Patescibacteria group bacterium]
MVETPTLREMLAAGVHFGHKRARWNPKMAEYIFATKNGVSVINLEKTKAELEKALEFITDQVKAGKNVVFVTSKRQAKEIVKEAALSCGMPYVDEKWRGGTLTNFDVVHKNFKTLKSLKEQIADLSFNKLSNIEQNQIKEKAAKLERIFGGLADLKKKPDILFLIGSHDEKIALKEAKNQGIATVAIVDTNADPNEVDYAIPANDDATKSIKLLVETVAKVISEVKLIVTQEPKN